MNNRDRIDPKCTNGYINDDRLRKFMEKTGYGREKTKCQFPMKWHDFQIILLLIDALYIIMNGLTYFTGARLNQYGNYAEQVYLAYPMLKVCDMAYGICLCLAGIFQLFVRNRLRKLKAGSYMLFIYRCAFVSVTTTAYMFAAGAATEINQFTPLSIFMICINVSLAVIDYFYYKKRAEIFKQ